MRTTPTRDQADDVPEKKRAGDHPQRSHQHAGILYNTNREGGDELKKIRRRLSQTRTKQRLKISVGVHKRDRRHALPATHLFTSRRLSIEPKTGDRPGDLTIAAPEGSGMTLPRKDPGTRRSGRRLLALARDTYGGTHASWGGGASQRSACIILDVGIFETPADLHVLGLRPHASRPSRRLATTKFVRQGWSLKAHCTRLVRIFDRLSPGRIP